MATPLGSPMKFQVTFLDETQAPFDPVSGIKIKVKDPRGAIAPYAFPGTLTKTSVGTYWIEVLASIAGDWRAKGTGVLANGQTVTTEDVIEPVLPSEIP